MDIDVTISGNLAADTRLTFLPDGTPVCQFRVLVNRPPVTIRGERVQPAPRPFTVVAFGDLASHAHESLRRGDRVTVRSGDLYAEAWSHRDTGAPMAQAKLRASEIALSVRFRTATSAPRTAPAQPADDQAPVSTTDGPPASAQAESDGVDGPVPVGPGVVVGSAAV